MKVREKLKIVSKKCDREPVYNEKYLKVKIKSFNVKINTNFHNNKIPKEGSQFICLSVILIDSVFRTGNNYYGQLFVEKCKYDVKEKQMPEYITGDMEISSDISDREDSDKEIPNEENYDDENSNKEN